MIETGVRPGRLLFCDIGSLNFTGQNGIETKYAGYPVIPANDPVSICGAEGTADGGRKSSSVHWDDAIWGTEMAIGIESSANMIFDMAVTALTDMSCQPNRNEDLRA